MNWRAFAVGLMPLAVGLSLSLYVLTQPTFRAQTDLRQRLVVFLLLVAVAGLELVLPAWFGWPIGRNAWIGTAIPVVALALILFIPRAREAGPSPAAKANRSQLVALTAAMLLSFVGSANLSGPQRYTMIGAGTVCLVLLAMRLLRKAHA